MRHFALFCSVLVLFFSCSVQNEPFTLMLFGDSLSAGYGVQADESLYAQLEQALRNDHYNVTVINGSVSGDTTSKGLSRQRYAIDKKPDGVILELGANDAMRRYPIPTIKENLQKLIENFQSNGIPVMLFGMRAPQLSDDPNAEYLQEFNDLYISLAKQYNLEVYPFILDSLFVNGSSDPLLGTMQNDNIHPSPKGVLLIVKNIKPTVKKFIKNEIQNKRIEKN